MVTLQKLARVWKNTEGKIDELLAFYKEHKEEYKCIEALMDNIDEVIDAMLENEIKMDRSQFLYVAKYKDFDIIDEKEIKYNYDYDVAVYEPFTKADYSTLTFTFDELVNMYIWQESIEEYGLQRVFLECLSEITWFGWNSAMHKKNQDKFLYELEESADFDEDNLIDADDFFNTIGYKQPGEEYYELLKEGVKKCGEYNQEVDKELGIMRGEDNDC